MQQELRIQPNPNRQWNLLLQAKKSANSSVLFVVWNLLLLLIQI